MRVKNYNHGNRMRIITILFFISNLLVAQEISLTLEQSLELGFKNSKELKISQSKLSHAEAIKDEVSSNMFPRLSLSAGYSRLSDVPPFSVNLPFIPSGGSFTIQETILDNYNLSASLEQPIFTGLKLSSLKSAADFNIKAEEILLEKEKNNLSEAIQKAFWNYYNAQQIKDLTIESLNTLRKHLTDTESFLDNGMVTRNDYLKLKLEVASMELKLLDINNKVQLAQSLFNKTIGLPLNSYSQVKVREIQIASNDKEFEKIKDEAIKNREEIISTNWRLKALKEKETASKSEWYPQLFAFANYYYNNPNQRYLPLDNEFNDSWSLGVALKWNIWDWGGTSAKVEQAKQDYFQLEKSYDLLKENVELDVYNNYLTHQNKIEKINLSKLQVESAEENYRITKEKYNQQLATSTELIDAETALLNAKTMLVTSKIEYELSKIALNKSAGRRIY
jgi:outer membrane protein TolC